MGGPRVQALVVCLLALCVAGCTPRQALQMLASRDAPASPPVGCTTTHDVFGQRFVPALRPKAGITIVPIGRDRDVALELAADLRREVSAPIVVAEASRITPTACDEASGRLMAEPALAAAASVANKDMLVLLVTAEELGSEQYGWQFGASRAVMLESVGIISVRRLALAPPRGATPEQARRTRLATLARRYVLLGWLGAPEERPGPRTEDMGLLTGMYSLDQLDAVADARLCDHVEWVYLREEDLRRCGRAKAPPVKPKPGPRAPEPDAPKGATLALRAARSAVASACMALRRDANPSAFHVSVQQIDFVPIDRAAGRRLVQASARLAEGATTKWRAAARAEVRAAARELGVRAC